MPVSANPAGYSRIKLKESALLGNFTSKCAHFFKSVHNLVANTITTSDEIIFHSMLGIFVRFRVLDI